MMEKSRTVMLVSRIVWVVVILFASLLLPVTTSGQGKILDWGKLKHVRYPTTIAPRNYCKQAHDFTIIFSGKAPFGITGLLQIEGGNKITNVPPGGSKVALAFLDLTSAAAGNYDDKIKIRCTTCPSEARCTQDYEEVTYRFTLADSTGEESKGGEKGPTEGDKPKGGTSGGGSSGGEEGPGTPGSTPDEDKKKEVWRCGPDLTAAFEDVLRRAASRLRGLPAADLKNAQSFYESNPMSLKVASPGNPFGLAIAPPQSETCPTSKCANSVTLWGWCFSDQEPQEILRGFVQSLLNMDNIGTDSRADSYEFGYRLAKKVKDFSEPGAVSATAEQMVHDFESSNGQWGIRPSHSGFMFCKPCTEIGGFLVDWTKGDWQLADGTRRPYRPGTD